MLSVSFFVDFWVFAWQLLISHIGFLMSPNILFVCISMFGYVFNFVNLSDEFLVIQNGTKNISWKQLDYLFIL